MTETKTSITADVAPAVTAFFTFATAFLDKLPDWLQRLKSEHLDLVTNYKTEWGKPVNILPENGGRDGQLADKLRIKLDTFEEEFWNEVQTNSVKK